MSLYSALFAGVSGLSAEASAMAGVADNISNINTVGYKKVDTQFSTMVSEGRSAATYSAGGVNAAPRTLISKGGLLQTSESSTDLGIDGQGFFVTRSGTGANTQMVLTRAGSFSPDDEGFLRNTAGLYLQGWQLDATGKFNNNGDISSLKPIKLKDLIGTATATTKLDARINLQASTPARAGAYAAGDMAAGTVAPDFTKPFQFYDSQGVRHDAKLSVVKTAANTWQAELYAVPATDVTVGAGVPAGMLASGTIAFNPDGTLDRAGSTPALFGTIAPAWTNGAGSMPIKLNFGDNGTANGFSQSDNPSALYSQAVDGGLLGAVSSINIDKKGVVNAQFADGSRRAVFQLPLATVTNPDGLDRISGNGYQVSGSSGPYQLNLPGDVGTGEIAGGKLEASTVDLAQEFTNMIRFQRAYSASSKVITTVDDMLQEVGNLKR